MHIDVESPKHSDRCFQFRCIFDMGNPWKARLRASSSKILGLVSDFAYREMGRLSLPIVLEKTYRPMIIPNERPH